MLQIFSDLTVHSFNCSSKKWLISKVGRWQWSSYLFIFFSFFFCFTVSYLINVTWDRGSQVLISADTVNVAKFSQLCLGNRKLQSFSHPSIQITFILNTPNPKEKWGGFKSITKKWEKAKVIVRCDIRKSELRKWINPFFVHLQVAPCIPPLLPCKLCLP